MIACSCSSPDCVVNGCAQARKLRENYPYRDWQERFQPTPLTAEDVRRIIREELARLQPHATPETVRPDEQKPSGDAARNPPKGEA